MNWAIISSVYTRGEKMSWSWQARQGLQAGGTINCGSGQVSFWLARLLCPWNSPGKNTGVGSHPLFQGIFLTQGLNLVFCIVGRFFTIWTNRETQESSLLRQNSIKGAREDVWKTTLVFFIRSNKLPELWLLEEFQEWILGPLKFQWLVKKI